MNTQARGLVIIIVLLCELIFALLLSLGRMPCYVRTPNRIVICTVIRLYAPCYACPLLCAPPISHHAHILTRSAPACLWRRYWEWEWDAARRNSVTNVASGSWQVNCELGLGPNKNNDPRQSNTIPGDRR